MGYSDPGPSPRTARRIASELAELVNRSGIVYRLSLSQPPAGVSTSAFFHPIGPTVWQVSCSWMPHTRTRPHEIPRLARFVPLLSSVGILRLLGVSFGPSSESLPPSTQRFARATRFRAAGYQAAADEIIHIRDS